MRARLAGIAFAAVAFFGVVFAFVLHARGEWVWDDVYLVAESPAIRSASGLSAVLGQDLWGGATGEPTQLYHPVPMATIWLEARLFGVSLVPMRLFNVLVHVVDGLLLMALARRRGLGEWPARAAALIFLLHPASTEAVMWITGLHDLLGVAFILCALLAWPKRPAVAALSCALAFLCKEAFVVAPVLVLVADPPRDRRALGRAGALFVAIAAVFGLRAALHIRSGSAQVGASLLDHARNYATIVVHYARELVTFTNAPTVERFVPTAAGPAAGVLAGIALLLAGLFLTARRTAPRADGQVARGLLFGVLVILVALAPHVVSMPVIGMFGNRYAYLPLAGFALVCGEVVALAERVAKARAPRLAPLVPGAIAVGAAVLALDTGGEATAWRSPVTLFGADVERAPDDSRALYHYGHAVFARSGCRPALPYYVRAVRAEPTYQRAWHNVAGCLINEGRWDDAVPAARNALTLAPGDARAEYNLGVALAHAGEPEEGIAHLEQALAHHGPASTPAALAEAKTLAAAHAAAPTPEPAAAPSAEPSDGR